MTGCTGFLLARYNLSLELLGECVAPGCFQVRYIRPNCFGAINIDYQTMSTNAAQDCEWRVVAFGDLAHGISVSWIEADDDS